MRAPSTKDVGPGWRQIVEILLRYCEMHGITPLQIKEKFGYLRFYYEKDGKRNSYEPFNQLLEQAEKQAEKTCEWCGAPGRLRQTQWRKTLCDLHELRWYDGERWWLDADSKSI